MEFIANTINGIYLRDIIEKINGEDEISQVLAAVAYGSSFNNKEVELLNHCIKKTLSSGFMDAI